MTCPFRGHALNFLKEVLALTQTRDTMPKVLEAAVARRNQDCGKEHPVHANTSRRAASQIAMTPGCRSFRSAEIA
jgi:hypothetical protein